MRYFLLLLLLLMVQLGIAQNEKEETIKDVLLHSGLIKPDQPRLNLEQFQDTIDLYNLDDFRESLFIYNIVVDFQDKPLTLENVKNAIEAIGILRPDNALEHMCRESGNFKSQLAKIANNLCGMRKARKRQTFALSQIYKGYATYEHWIYSVIDYWIWQGKSKHDIVGNYRNYLARRGYFPASSK